MSFPTIFSTALLRAFLNLQSDDGNSVMERTQLVALRAHSMCNTCRTGRATP
jgi:hypothetical protein